MSKNKKKKEGKRSGESTKIYARVRGLMPWEPKKVSLAVEGTKKVRNKSGKVTNEYDFQKVFKPNSTNEQVFKVIVVPMISNVLKGYNAVLIAYGQTGSGKTFSMLGKPRLGVVGLLPRMLAYMVDQKSVTKVELSAVEAFGHHVAKIELFDLYDPDNQVASWNDKKGNTSLDMMKARTVQISDAQDAHDKIIFAHAASHFAPTGKNPESSRGHVTFVAKITQQKSKHETMVSYFVMVDCAGSEGETAFTEEFKARVDQQTLMARRLEAGTINTGLSELQVIFNQLRRQGELTKAIGNGLRRVLHPYINVQTYLSVLFTLSPSINNAKATESTLKFAVTAGMVKVKPMATRGVVNWQQLVKELRAHIEEQEKVMDENTDNIDSLERQINRVREAIARSKRGLPAVAPKEKRRKQAAGGVTPQLGMRVSVEQVGDNYDNNELVPKDFVGAARDTQSAPDGGDTQVQVSGGEETDALMGMLDSSIMDLMAELDPEFRAEVEKEKNKSNTLQVQIGRQRTVSAEENDEAMQLAMKKWNTQAQTTKPKSTLKPGGASPVGVVPSKKKRASKVEKIDKIMEIQEKEYVKLKEVQEKLNEEKSVDDMDQEELTSHATDIQILLHEQEAITRGLEDSKRIILEFLQSDGREALIQFFKMRGFI